jgi:tRNA modification GTPase
VGKSSLMNALLDKERAIVSPIPGTTRDIVEDQMRLNGLNFRVIDTAGIRETEEIIEAEGIRRSKAALEEADLVLLLLDASEGLREGDRSLLKLVEKRKTIVIWNKMDIARAGLESVPFPHVVEVSAKNKAGLDKLHREIDKVVWTHGPPSKEEVMITRVRHHQALQGAIAACRKVAEGLREQLSPEFLASDMRQCLYELGRIVGTNVGEDILSAIFSTFCIGK